MLYKMFDIESDDIFLNTILYLIFRNSMLSMLHESPSFVIDDDLQEEIDNSDEYFDIVIHDNSKKVRRNLNIDITMIIKGKELFKWIIDFLSHDSLSGYRHNFVNEYSTVDNEEEHIFFNSLISQFHDNTSIKFEILDYLTDFYNFNHSYENLEISIVKKSVVLCFMFRFIPNFYNEFLSVTPYYNQITEIPDCPDYKDDVKIVPFDEIFSFLKFLIVEIIKLNPKCLSGEIPNKLIEFDDLYKPDFCR